MLISVEDYLFRPQKMATIKPCPVSSQRSVSAIGKSSALLLGFLLGLVRPVALGVGGFRLFLGGLRLFALLRRLGRLGLLFARGRPLRRCR